MKAVTIEVKGKAYPCYPTAGAMLRFRRKKGKEVTAVNPEDMDDLGTYLFCCAKSASKREDVPFEFRDEEEFLDCVLPEDITRWAEALSEPHGDPAPEGDEEKKSPSA